MIRFKHAGVLYVLSPDELVRYLPGEVLRRALERGKAYKRRDVHAKREQEAVSRSAQKRDMMLTG